MKVLMIPTARATFAIDVAKERGAAAKALLQELGAEVFGPEELVMNDDDVAAAHSLVSEPHDVIIHVHASFCDAGPAMTLYRDVEEPIVSWSFREPGPVGDRLWLNSLCGSNLMGHALVRAGKSLRLLYGDPDEPSVREALTRIIAGELPDAPELPGVAEGSFDDAAAEQALQTLSTQAIGVIGDAPKGFTPSQFDGQLIKELFHLDVVPMELDSLLEDIEAVPQERRETELVDALRWQPSLEDSGADNLGDFAAVTTSLRDWQKKTGVQALALECWPGLPTKLRVCPCSSMSRLADEEIATQCERDVYGAVTMLLLQALGSGITYLVDTVDLDQDKNLVRFWHCGAAATKLAADPDPGTQGLHCNRKIGVAGNFPLKPGRVVAVRLTEDPKTDGLRMLIASGEAIKAPNRFQGNTADVIMDSDAENFVTSLVTGGFPHHTVLSWADVRPGLRAVARKLNIPVVEFN